VSPGHQGNIAGCIQTGQGRLRLFIHEDPGQTVAAAEIVFGRPELNVTRAEIDAATFEKALLHRSFG